MTDRPLQLNATIRCEDSVDVDVPAIIREHLDEYWAVDMTGYAEWERPAVFLDGYLRESVSFDTFASHVTSRFDDMDVDFTWKQADTERLIELVPEAGPDREPSPEDVARRPGPLDQPLPMGV